MTIKLLDQWNGNDAGTVVTTDPATEAGLIAAGRATADLTGGVRRPKVLPPAPVPPVRSRPVARSQMIIGDSIANRGCHMPHTPADRATRILSGPWAVMNANSASFLMLMETHPAVPNGSGQLRWHAASRTMFWTAPGDTEGPGVTISHAKMFYALESGSPNLTAYIGTIPLNMLSQDAVQTVTISNSFPFASRRSNVASSGIIPQSTALLGCPYTESYAFTVPSSRAEDHLAAAPQWENIFTDVTDIILGANGWQGTADERGNLMKQIAAIEQIIIKRQAIGSRVQFSSLRPVTSYNTLQRQLAQEGVMLMRALADRYKCAMVDAHTLFADPATGNPAASFASDGQHPTSLGAFNEALLGWVPLKQDGVGQFASMPAMALYDAATAPYGNLLNNGNLTGTGGTKSARVTGTVPSGHQCITLNGSVMTATSVAPADAGAPPRFNGKPGKCWAVTADNTGGVNGEQVYLSLSAADNTAGKIYAGDKIVLEIELQLSGTGIQYLGVWAQVGNLYNFAMYYDPAAAGAMFDLGGKTATFKLRSEPMIVEPGYSGLNFVVQAGALAGGQIQLKVDPSVVIHKVE